jgi:hypothetical protein
MASLCYAWIGHWVYVSPHFGYTEQQAFMLEAHLLLGGISSYDRHQDLRLDIDNMTYEVT